MTIHDYLFRLDTRCKTGISTEHSYRGDLQNLLEFLLPTELLVTNEPTRIKCGAPDYIISKGNIPIGYIEAKDLGGDLRHKSFAEQFNRYRDSLPNLIFTNYLDFIFIKNGEEIAACSIARLIDGNIEPLPSEFAQFTTLIIDFAAYIGQTITSPKKLAEMMAHKARLLANVIEKALLSNDEETLEVKEENITLLDQFKTFKTILIHDITHREFADIYAQTIAYGMFAARIRDTSLNNFDRVEAANLIPKSNPFLRKLFQYIAGYDLDARIKWIVDALADLFRATDVVAVLKNFGKSTQQNDPLIHFYETFLAEYDPKLRKARGVWYTPEPVVKFIVRAVDEILKIEFGLKQGLADSSKTKITVKTHNKKTADSRSKIKETETEIEVHKVQILDPACGTGTFLAEISKHVYQKFQSQKGVWSNYVEKDLIPRLNGFELLMASYAMAHLKMDLFLQETEFKPTQDQRLKIFLTNSLEEYHPETGTLFASWLSDEANQANKIKRDTPVMVIIGNPPYQGKSTNKGKWITGLLDYYKKEPSGGKLKEKNPKWLNNDYVKFIRLGEALIDKNGFGILAFITSNSYLDSPTFRGMRYGLLKTFDKIHILNLNGSLKRNSDENVFDITEGVSIILGIKTQSVRNRIGDLYYHNLTGARNFKYQELLNLSYKDNSFDKLEPVAPQYYFVPKDFVGQTEYNSWISIPALFPTNSIGVITARDFFSVREKQEDVEAVVSEFVALDIEAARTRFDLGRDVRDWSVSGAKSDLLKSGVDFVNIKKFDYRPFDIRYTYYTGRSKGFHCMPRGEVMRNFILGDNIGLLTCRQSAINTWEHVSITKNIVDDSRVSNRTKERGYVFPLWLYEATQKTLLSDEILKVVPNINKQHADWIIETIGLSYINSSSFPNNDHKKDDAEVFPQDVFDYVYAILHSPSYRKKYNEFLKIDFPRVPPAVSKEYFWQLVNFGCELRKLHLLESSQIDDYKTSYPISGNNLLEKPRFTGSNYELGKIWINTTQYFAGVTVAAWDIYIGGYQPAQKWLKDRLGRTLSHHDIFHYQKIIAVLTETIRVMQEIDRIPFERKASL